MSALIGRCIKNRLPAQKARPLHGRKSHRFRPSLEILENRMVPTVTYQGGGVLPNVEVQGLYLGSQWYTNSTYYQECGYLQGYLSRIVQSSYMDMLTNAGYGVGRGSFAGGRISLANLSSNYYLTDDTIQSYLQSYIDSGGLQSPDGNRLYVVFVEPDIAIMDSSGATSQTSFLGYHGAFGGTDAYGNAATIHYAVIAYPGGAVGNAAVPWLAAVNQLTDVASHELAEAVTDPNVNYAGLGWYDNQNGEIGDIVEGQTVWLNGYAVQRIADQNDQAMTPLGATAATHPSYVLINGGYLFEYNSAGWTYLASGVSSISDQSIDNQGQAMIDVVFRNGNAYEYHEGTGWQYLWYGAVDAKAGQGVSYVLFAGGVVCEYNDASQSWTYVDSSINAIDAGTDHAGVNMVDVVLTSGYVFEHSDSSGWHYLGSNAQSVSAGQQGYSAFVDIFGTMYLYHEAWGTAYLMTVGVSRVSVGSDTNGLLQLDVVFTNGVAYEFSASSGWSYLNSGIQSVSKAQAGAVDVIFAYYGCYYQHNANGWTLLDYYVVEAT
jgi:hypothetical protein